MMSRELCHCCLQVPSGGDEKQPYSMGMPEDGILITVPLCMICMILVCEEVSSRAWKDGGSYRPIHGSIDMVKESFRRGSALKKA